MTAAEVLKAGEEILKSADIMESKVDAWLLFSFVTGYDRTAFFMHSSEPLLEDVATRYNEAIQLRKKHVPVQYITGEAFFMGHRFFVNENVLIPRADTECLVEQVFKYIRPKDRILDMCTGSGCILISLLLGSKAECGVAVDISEAALEVAKKNCKDLAVCNAEILLSNLFEKVTGTFDVIVSNPPYIPSKVVDGLMSEVVDHEPRIALDGDLDGLFFYEAITKDAVRFLNIGGYLCYEIGYDQAEAVTQIMKKNGFEEICVLQDLAGLDRVVTGKRR